MKKWKWTKRFKNWLIRKLGGYTRDDLAKRHDFYEVRHSVIYPIKLKVTDTMEDGYARCMPETTAQMYMARKLAERIYDDKLYEIKYENGPYGTVTRTMTVEILPPRDRVVML